MNDNRLLERPTFGRPDERRDGAASEAAEIAGLLACARVRHASALWFQLLELATQQAFDWSERFAAAGAPLSARAAAVLGLRALAAEILSSPTAADDQRGAAEACLGVCHEPQSGSHLPPRRRRWGEGAAPSSPQRQGPLLPRVGCC